MHFVRPEMDDGPIVTQAAVAVNPHEDASRLAERVLLLEHLIYPEALRLVAEGRVKVVGSKAEIKEATYSNTWLVNPEPMIE